MCALCEVLQIEHGEVVSLPVAIEIGKILDQNTELIHILYANIINVVNIAATRSIDATEEELQLQADILREHVRNILASTLYIGGQLEILPEGFDDFLSNLDLSNSNE